MELVRTASVYPHDWDEISNGAILGYLQEINETTVETCPTAEYRCVECNVVVPTLDAPMTDERVASGYYNDYCLFINRDGDPCTCKSFHSRSWCLVCDSCTTCSKN